MMMNTRCLLGILLLVVVLSPQYASAQSEAQLFARGKEAYSSGNWASALKYLYAYHSRQPASYEDSRHRDQVRDAIEFSEDRIAYALRVQKQASNQQGSGNVGASVSGLGVAGPPLEPSGSSSKPKSYEVVCRGTGEMIANYYPRGTGSLLQIHFEKAPVKADKRAPGSGECAWRDRRINAKEPFWLRFRSDEQISRVLIVSNREVTVYGPKKKGGDLKRLLDAVATNRLFRVKAYRDGQFLTITDVR